MDQLENILNKVLASYPQGFTIANSTSIVIDIMKQVEAIHNMSGLEKKALVLNILNRIVDVTDSGTYDREIDAILKIMIPTLIDRLVDIDKGKLKIKKNAMWCC